MKHKTLPNPKPKPKPKKTTHFNSTTLPLCFQPSTTTHHRENQQSPPSTTTHHHSTTTHHRQPPSTTITSTPTLTTCLFQTNLGIFALTWSNSLFSHSLHLTLHPQPPLLSLSSLSFHLTLKPFLFWKKRGFKKLSSLYIYWDLTHAKFGSGFGSRPEPSSGFYIAVVHEGEIVLLVGDLEKEAISRIKPKKNVKKKIQSLVIRREHIVGDRLYSTTIDFGGKSRVILIELNEGPDPKLVIRVDSKRVIQIKHLKWKFRGSERVEVDGSHIQVSWDVYNWLFDEDEDYCTSNNGGSHGDGCALFTFRFEKDNQGQNWKNENNNNNVDNEEGQNGNYDEDDRGKMGKVGGVKWSQDYCGLNYERKKMKKKMLVKINSGGCSSSSISSMSSSSSVLEWESVEENELKGPTGFSLLLYAWKN